MSQETSDLDQGQRARVEALNTARSILSGRGEVDITDIHAIATFILHGGELYPTVELTTDLEPIRTLAGDIIDVAPDPWSDRCPSRSKAGGRYCSLTLGHTGWHEAYATRDLTGDRLETWLYGRDERTDAHD